MIGLCGQSIRNTNKHTWIFVLVTLKANSGTFVGVGLSRAGGTAGRSWFCTIGAGFTLETLWCVGHPWEKPTNQLVIINREKELRKEQTAAHKRRESTWDGNVSQHHRFDNVALHSISCCSPVQHIVAAVQLKLHRVIVKMREKIRERLKSEISSKWQPDWQQVWWSAKAALIQTLYLLQLLSEIFIQRLAVSVDWHWSFWTYIRGLEKQARSCQGSPLETAMSTSTVIFKNTYEELEVNAVVGVEIFKGHRSGFLQAHSIGQCCSALICIWGYVITFWGPGWAGETAAETVVKQCAHCFEWFDGAETHILTWSNLWGRPRRSRSPRGWQSRKAGCPNHQRLRRCPESRCRQRTSGTAATACPETPPHYRRRLWGDKKEQKKERPHWKGANSLAMNRCDQIWQWLLFTNKSCNTEWGCAGYE